MSSSKELIQDIESRLMDLDGWEGSHPIALGSWARGELCPKSDLDILFIGDEAQVVKVVGALQQEGYKVRARVPESLDDWTIGVQSKDILSLLIFKGLTVKAQSAAEAQRQLILTNKALKNSIFKDLLKERKERHQRFDSMNNFLEPNIKLAPGGLRDIEQSLQVLVLIDKNSVIGPSHPALKALWESKHFLLKIRHCLHSLGFLDQLVGTEQNEIGKSLGFLSHRDFMREVSRTLSRAHFYSDWIFEYFKASKKYREIVDQSDPQTGVEIMSLLRQDSSLLMQRLIRSKMDSVHRSYPLTQTQLGLLLREAVLFRTTDDLTQAIFRSKWISKLCPRIKPLVGYVQHDQYHRFTAEAHILQACRELKRVWRSAKSLGPLSWVHKKLGAQDWEILSWVSLYHDLAKGHSGDHSVLGESWVRHDLSQFGVRGGVIDEVAFLVRYHLHLSVAAFRKNPQDPKTWSEFFEVGFTNRRIFLLAVFTVIDIRATNPEAWTEWKATLLNDSVKKLLAPEQQEFYSLTQKLISEFSYGLGEALDPSLISYFNKSTIEKDFLQIKKTHSENESINHVRLLRDKKKKKWVRIQCNHDKKGLVEAYVRSLFLTGVSVQQALIQTLPEVGVYDLFQVTTKLSSTQLMSRMRAGLSQESPQSQPPHVNFKIIEVVSESANEVVLSFQGVDQRGLLWAIAAELQNAGVMIVSARVHTWGRQVEDLIHIRPIENLNDLVTRLKTKWHVG